MPTTTCTRLAEITLQDMSTGCPIRFEMWDSGESYFIEMRNLSSNGTAIVRESDDREAMDNHWEYMTAYFERDPHWELVEA